VQEPGEPLAVDPTPAPVRRIVTVTPWDDRTEGEGELLLRINVGAGEGAAWGFGGHPTTSLCLSLILGLYQGRGPRPARVLDVGFGAGVLSIACARLGARSVQGVDVNQGAPATAAVNAALNGAAGCDFSTTPLAEVTGSYDLVVANLWSAALLIELAPDLAARAAGGHLLVSGFKDFEADAVEERFTGLGLRLVNAIERPGDGRVWVALLLRDRAPTAISPGR
jgi:ribosomal protein L11 methyltransferase